MKTINKSFLYKLFCCSLFTCCFSTIAMGQKKFHIDLDYNYNLGLHENFNGQILKRNKYNMGGNSLHISPRYDITTDMSVGIGIGLDRYTELDYNTMPLYITTRYNVIENTPNMYAFSDLGYAIKIGDFTKGFTGRFGIGYTYKLAKNIGINLQVAYNLKEFKDIQTYYYDLDNGEFNSFYANSTRHSISLGIGISL